MTVVAIPYLWVLFVLWGPSVNVLRNVYANGYGGAFYDLQARAILSGHLYVPRGSLALETWTHNGHDYTYFGVFPSLLRIPILLVTHRFDGELTAVSLLISWFVTGVLTALILWRVRVMLRGEAVLGWAESLTMGVVVASVCGGSVLMFLGSNPYVYSEDKAWSVALSLGAFLALLGMFERPTWTRVASAGGFIVAANLTRATEGYACVVGALLVGVWFALGKRGTDLRRWYLPLFGIAILALAAGGAVSWVKFGVLFGLPVSDYTAFHLLHDSQINGGRYFDSSYLPSTLWAYLRPSGIRFTSLFPYVTLPSGPTGVVGHILFDNRTRTASVTASMPLLFLLSCIGVVGSFRRHVSGTTKMLRLLLLASAAGTAAVLFYGWIADRFLADFLPFLILASAIGAVLLWRYLEGWTARSRHVVVGLIVALGIFGVIANVGLSITPTDAWTQDQASAFLRTQIALSRLTGKPISGHILSGERLPYWAPADTLFIAGDCRALYVSNGEDYTGVLDQRAEHRTWVPIEEAGFNHIFEITVGPPNSASGLGIPLVTLGQATISIHSRDAPRGRVFVRFTVQDPHYASASATATVQQGSTHTISIEVDPYSDVIVVSMDGYTYLSGPVTSGESTTARVTSGETSSSLAIRPIRSPSPSLPLCHQLFRFR